MIRTADRWDDRFELSMDNRQIFYLFFGSAVIACLVFGAGILVGKRIESRRIRDRRPAVDALTLVDQRSRLAAPELTFHSQLVRSDSAVRRDEPPEVREMAGFGGSTPAGRSPRVDPVAPNQINGVPGARRPGPRPAVRTAAFGGAPVVRFTLQVSAFKQRAEAQRMVRRLAKKGYQAYLVATAVRGRGLWYRVRVGGFASIPQAQRAKVRFESATRLTAYVSRR